MYVYALECILYLENEEQPKRQVLGHDTSFFFFFPFLLFIFMLLVF